MIPKMRRIKRELDNRAAYEVLENAKRGVLAVNGPDGYPYAVPINFVMHDGRICFHCAKVGLKHDCLVKDAKVCFTANGENWHEGDDWAWWLRSVTAFGHCSFVTDEAEKNQILYDLGMKYFPTEEEVISVMEKNGKNCDVAAITIDHITGKLIHEK